MGIYPSPDKCVFTGLSTTNMTTSQDCFDYFIEVAGCKIGFKLSSQYQWTTSSLIKNNLTILRGDIFNRKWPTEGLLINEEEIEKQIAISNKPTTPKEKLDNLFNVIFTLQESEGALFSIEQIISNTIFWGKLYFNTADEYRFYLRTLDEQGLINAKPDKNGKIYYANITFKGLNYKIEISEAGLLSENCFVAMSFSKDMKSIRNSIKKAISDTGFKPFIIDEIHIDSEKTINDEIIASIKKSRFCISDFTEQKDGVYFEAGYALGRGLKVIYTCRSDWFEKSHFDTKHFPHIIYENDTDLYDKLKLKIEAWIK